jgi:glycosyltransferase involved in cell wall biosynthesis
MKKSLCIIAYFNGPKLGIGVFMQNLLAELLPIAVREFREVTLITNSHFLRKTKLVIPHKVNLIKLKYFNNNYIGKLYQLFSFPFKATKYDIVFLPSDPLIGFYLNKISNVVSVIHDLNEWEIANKYGKFRTLWRKYFLIKRTLKKSLKVIVISDFVKGQIGKVFKNYYSNKIIRIYNGVAENDGNASKPKGINSDDNFLITVGRIDPVGKNLYFSLQVYRKYLIFDPNLKYYFIGGINSSTSKKAREFLYNIKSFDNVKYLGQISDGELNWLYANAKALFFFSKFEGFGFPLIEAYSFGCPVVTHSQNKVFNEIGENLNLKISEKDVSNPELLISKIDKYTKNINKESLKKVAAKFDWLEVAKKYIKVLKN